MVFLPILLQCSTDRAILRPSIPSPPLADFACTDCLLHLFLGGFSLRIARSGGFFLAGLTPPRCFKLSRKRASERLRAKCLICNKMFSWAASLIFPTRVYRTAERGPSVGVAEGCRVCAVEPAQGMLYHRAELAP